VVAAVAEVGHLVLGVFLSGSPGQMFKYETIYFAWNNIIVKAAAPMIIANALGVGIFFVVFYIYRRELWAYKERDKFYREVEQRNIELSSVYEIAQAISASSLDPDDALQTILEQVRKMVPYEGAEICLYISEKEELCIQKCVGNITLNGKTGSYKLGEGFAGWVAARRRSLLLPNIKDLSSVEPALSALEVTSSIRSYVGVPLMVGDQLVGTLGLASTRPQQFDEHAKRLLEAIAPQAAIAIHNAHRIRQREEALRRQIEELRVEIDEARKKRQVEEITDTNYFRELQEKARKLRNKNG